MHSSYFFEAKSLVIILTRVVVVCKHLARFSFHSQDWHKVYVFILQGSCRIGYPCTLGNNRGNDSEVDSNSASAVVDDNLPMGKVEESESDVKMSGVCASQKTMSLFRFPLMIYATAGIRRATGPATCPLTTTHPLKRTNTTPPLPLRTLPHPPLDPPQMTLWIMSLW